MAYEKSHRESVENYLKTILSLSEQKKAVRSIDLADALGYSKASVSVAMKKLQSEDLVKVSEKGVIALTGAGEKIAGQILEKHRFFTEFLKAAGVNDKSAVEEACRIEHVISDETFDALQRYYS